MAESTSESLLIEFLKILKYEDKSKHLTKREKPSSTNSNGKDNNPENPERCYINKDLKTVVFITKNFQNKSDNIMLSIGRSSDAEEGILSPFRDIYRYKKIVDYYGKGNDLEIADYKFFILAPCAKPKNGNEDKYKTVESFIVSLEPIKISNNDLSAIKNKTSMTLGKYNELVKHLTKKESTTENVTLVPYRTKVENNDFYATFIPIKRIENIEQNKTVTEDEIVKACTFLKLYMLYFDSRTYKDVVDVTKWIATEMHKNNAKELDLPRNLLIYGAPGTGKSHYIDDKFKNDFYPVPKDEDERKKYIKNLEENIKKEYNNESFPIREDADIEAMTDADIEAMIKDEFFTRVTFYEDYSYENFVGCYKPVEDEDGKITYKFEAGPFIDIYIKAKKDSNHNYLLAIEEINRADAAAVFGDLFQVLDRDDNGNSEYSVKPEAALNKYLAEHLKDYDYDGTISLPSNLYIWATMNSADQGVHVLDSAFKRRWQFLYMDIDNSPSSAKADGREIVLPFGNSKIKTYAWGSFRNAVNEVLEKNNIEEDRWVGAWFFKDEELRLIEKFYEGKDKTTPNPLVDKLLAYLLQDVVKMNKDILFQGKYHNMSSIRKALSNSEVNIFDVLTQKINIDKKEDEDIADKREIVLPVGDNKTETYTWGSFRKAVNEVLEKNNIEKDRQIEAWFFKGRELKSIETFYKEKDTDNKDNPLVDKLLERLSKIDKDIFKQGYSDISSVHGDLSNSVSPKSIFEVLNIDKNALEKVQETENPTPTDTTVTENG